jgi:hypothetical protein
LGEDKHIREEMKLPGDVATEDIFRERWIREYGEDKGEGDANEDNENSQRAKFVDGEVGCT